LKQRNPRDEEDDVHDRARERPLQVCSHDARDERVRACHVNSQHKGKQER
jgi:hypothetical protein